MVSSTTSAPVPSSWIGRRGPAVLVLAFLLTRLLLLLGAKPWDDQRRYSHFIYSDAAFYFWTAANLLDGHGYSSSPHEPREPATARPPLYPMFLAMVMLMFGRSVTAIFLAQVFLQLVTLALIFLAASWLFSRSTAFWLTLYSVLDPVLLVHAGYLYSETVYYLIQVVVVYLSVQGIRLGFDLKRVLPLGVLYGLGLLTRPIGLYFIPVVVLFIAAKEKKLRPILVKSAAFLLSIFVVLSPWLTRNYLQFGHWSLSTIQGSHLQKYLIANFLAAREGKSVEEIRERLLADPPQFANRFEESDYFTDQALGVIRQDIFAYAVFHLKSALPVLANANSKALSYLLGWEESPYEKGAERDIRAIAIIALNLLMLAAIHGFFLFGLWQLWKRRQLVLLLFLIAGVSYFVAIIGSEPSSRYRLSFLPFLLVGAGFGVHAVEKNLGRRGTHRQPAEREEDIRKD